MKFHHLCWLGAVLLTAQPGWTAPLRVLLLTGSNNHKWQTTTPVLKATLESTGRFIVDVETNVVAMAPASIAPYDVLLSNFNTFGKKTPGPVWNADMRAAFVDFIRQGKGLVVVHSGSSVFYDWPEFQQLAGTSWGEHTHHGKQHTNEIHIVSTPHPITRGVKDFSTFDEFWQTTDLAPGTTVLATVAPRKEFGGSGQPEPMALVTHLGAGRGFTLLLGHSTGGMDSAGFKILLQRGTEWAATGKIEEQK